MIPVGTVIKALEVLAMLVGSSREVVLVALAEPSDEEMLDWHVERDLALGYWFDIKKVWCFDTVPAKI